MIHNKTFNPMAVLLLLSIVFSQQALAKSASEIDAEVDASIKKFKTEIKGGEKFLSQVKGYLVIPAVIKGGFVVAGEYGEGAMRINGVTKNYYTMTSASIGLQAGAKKYAILIAFISEVSLQNFIKSNGWEAGVDGSIAVSDWGKGKNITSMSYEKPIIAFVYDAKGLMASISVEGKKFQKIVP